MVVETPETSLCGAESLVFRAFLGDSSPEASRLRSPAYDVEQLNKRQVLSVDDDGTRPDLPRPWCAI
jgi:hypothetical protein